MFVLTRTLALLIALSLLGLIGATCPAYGQETEGLRAGAATANITPPLGSLIVGGWTPMPAAEVHDELHARCLVLDDGSTQIAIVLVDSVGVPREVFDRAKSIIEGATGLPKDHMLMAATHTHSAATSRGPNSMVYDEELSDYQRFLASRIADGVRIAMHRLEPAKIAWGGVDEPSELFNRRWYVLEDEQRRNPFGGVDQVRMNPGRSSLIRPAGPVDPEVSFLSVQANDGRPISLLGNYSLHYVGGVTPRTISADYFAIFSNRMGELFGTQKQFPPFVGIMSNGTSGDVNNINFRDRGPRREPFEKMTEVGNKVAQRVYEAHGRAQFRQAATLDIRQRELTLQVRKPSDELLAYVKTVKAKPEDAEAFHSRERVYADRVLQLAESPDTVQVLLQTVRIGDLSIAAIPFEVFTEIGLEIKERSPFDDTFTIELANGSYGYLPTPEQHELGGYETWLGTNRVAKDSSRKITEAIIEMMTDMHAP